MQKEKVGRILDAKRKGLGWSKRALARSANVNHSQIVRLLSGHTSPTTALLKKVCDGLQCSTAERSEIYHAAGYLSPEEIDEEMSVA